MAVNAEENSFAYLYQPSLFTIIFLTTIQFCFLLYFDLQIKCSHGVMHHKFSHIRVVLREIDFPLKIYQQKSLNQKKKWLYHQQRAENDARAAMAKREELERLEKQQEAQLAERKAAASKQ